jgi:hypothetical protein
MEGIAGFLIGLTVTLPCLGFGLLLLLKPYKVAKIRAKHASAGSNREFEDIEPKAWFVVLVRFVGLWFVILWLYLLYRHFV